MFSEWIYMNACVRMAKEAVTKYSRSTPSHHNTSSSSLYTRAPNHNAYILLVFYVFLFTRLFLIAMWHYNVITYDDALLFVHKYMFADSGVQIQQHLARLSMITSYFWLTVDVNGEKQIWIDAKLHHVIDCHTYESCMSHV